MNISIKKVYAAVAMAGIAASALAAITYAVGIRVNTTRSIPVGIYQITDAPIEKGAYVLFCPPDIGVFAIAKKRGYITGGFCPGNYGYMMKKILAAKNDVVKVTNDGVYVDGSLLEHSKVIEADPSGRKLPRYQFSSYVLGSSELLLMSDITDTSFDGRYFGPINHSQIKSVIRPIFTW